MLTLAVVLLSLMELLLRPPESSLNHLDMKDMGDVIRRKGNLEQDLRRVINETQGVLSPPIVRETQGTGIDELTNNL